MAIEKIPHHYSFESIPSVYDEEAMTALEMCGKLSHKVNEVITAVNGWNVPMITEVSPTGDKTGELDRAVIQGKLDAGYAVHLAAGEYYLNGPLIFRPGYMLRGDSQLNTVLNCKAGFIDHENAVSVDHVEVRDVRVKGPDSGVGIDISRKVSGIETGGRYAHFMNVYITGYETAVRLGGCWCTNFTHCRIEATNICVEQRGSCNHVKYDHCMFLGPVDAKTTTGVKITAEQGAENYGITFDHCEFERHNIAIHAYFCVALNVTSIYVEGVKTVFQLDSCPGFLCDGGYISYPERVCNTAKTNGASVFSKCTGAIRNLFIRVNSIERWYMTSTTGAFPLKIEGIDCVNDAGGECVVNTQQVHSLYNGHEFALTYKPVHTFNCTELKAANALPLPTVNSEGNNGQIKLQSVTFMAETPFTATASTTVTLAVWNGVGYDDLFKGYVNAGTEYNIYNPINLTYQGSDYRKLVFDSFDALWINSVINFTNPSFGAEKLTLRYTVINDKIIL